MLSLTANGAPAQQVAVHDAPIKSVRYVQVPSTNFPVIVTGSWDRTVKYWDARVSGTTPIGVLKCQERIYSMDTKDNLLVVATAERYVNFIHLASPGQFYRSITSPLSHQTKVVTCYKEADGVAIGSIEGRVGMESCLASDKG